MHTYKHSCIYASIHIYIQTCTYTYIHVHIHIVVVMFLGGVAYGRFVRGLSKRQTEALSNSMQIAEENLSLIRIVKLFNGENKSMSDYTKSLDKVYSLAQSNALATSGRITVFITIGGGFVLHVIYNCGILISDGTLTIGQTSALAGYLLVCGGAYQGLVGAYGDIQKALGACDRVVQLMKPEDVPLLSSPVRPLIFTGSSSLAAPSIRLSDVHFKYATANEKPILNGLSMYVPSGAKQAIVGLSGSGKSSILMLMAKMYEPDSGKIFVNDIDISSIDGREIRESIVSIVPQENALFNDSIRNNIWFPNEPPATGKELECMEAELIERARLSFISDWTNTVGERGQNLSGGTYLCILTVLFMCTHLFSFIEIH